MKTFNELRKQNKSLKKQCAELIKKVTEQEKDLNDLHINYKQFIAQTGSKRELINECDYLKRRVTDLEMLLKHQIEHNIKLKGKLDEKN